MVNEQCQSAFSTQRMLQGLESNSRPLCGIITKYLGGKEGEYPVLDGKEWKPVNIACTPGNASLCPLLIGIANLGQVVTNRTGNGCF